jgi:hypothetical protein
VVAVTAVEVRRLLAPLSVVAVSALVLFTDGAIQVASFVLLMVAAAEWAYVSLRKDRR